MIDRRLHQGLSRSQRLRKRSDFLRVQELGRRRSGTNLVVYALAPDQPAGSRLGVTVSKKVGNAVVRNLVKRRVKESYRRLPDRTRKSLDVVVIAKPSAAAVSYPALEGELRRLLASLPES